MKPESILDNLVERYPSLFVCKDSIYNAYKILIEAFSAHNKLLIAGNGGSAADSEHIVGELMKSFVLKREMSSEEAKEFKRIDEELGSELAEKLQIGLPSISLVGNSAFSTAYQNDVDPFITYAQEVYGYGNTNDVFLGITTSGNSKNILYSLITAKAKKMRTIVLTGKDGGLAKKYADVSIIVPESETYKIQELHLPVYHCLCLMVESYFFS